jgi:hypothetical protein
MGRGYPLKDLIEPEEAALPPGTPGAGVSFPPFAQTGGMRTKTNTANKPKPKNTFLFIKHSF